jgi:hypothetical protein
MRLSDGERYFANNPASSSGDSEICTAAPRSRLA